MTDDMINLRKDANVSDKHQNRAHDTKSEEPSDIKVGLYDIDGAIMGYMSEVIRPFIVKDGNRLEVPVRYALPERWKQIRKDGILRDDRGKIQAPMIVIRRESISKGSLHNPVNKYYEKNFHSTGWNSRNRYDRFAVVNGIKESQRYVSLTYPDYYDLTYKCVVWADYIEEMNHIIEQLSFEAENYWGNKNKYKFRTSIEEFTDSLEVPSDQDRVVRSEFTMEVNAYLIPETEIDKYGNLSTVQKNRFTAKKLIIQEKIITDNSDL